MRNVNDQMQTPYTIIKLQIRLEITWFSKVEYFNAIALIKISLWFAIFAALQEHI